MGAEPTPQIPDIEALDKTDAVLLGLLATLGKEVFRTKMVKLTYLLDDLSFRNDYATITGLNYEWDSYGPNAVGNEIVKRLDRLSRMGLVHLRESTTPFGNPTYGYRISDTVENADLPLSVHDRVLIQSIIHQYGNMNRESIVRASKQTLPMKNANQYETLEFQVDPALEALKASFQEDPDFVKMTMEAAVDQSPRITLEELRASVAQSSNP